METQKALAKVMDMVEQLGQAVEEVVEDLVNRVKSAVSDAEAATGTAAKKASAKKAPAKKAPAKKASAKKAPAKKASAKKAAAPTKDELYAKATKLKIAGRSKMTKAQLAAAIKKAG